MAEKTDQAKIDGYDSLNNFSNRQASILRDQADTLEQIQNLVNSDIYDKHDDWFLVKEQILKIFGGYIPGKCMMCDHSKWTWYEVLEATCGKLQPADAINTLCEVHQQIAREQIGELRPK